LAAAAAAAALMFIFLQRLNVFQMRTLMVGQWQSRGRSPLAENAAVGTPLPIKRLKPTP